MRSLFKKEDDGDATSAGPAVRLAIYGSLADLPQVVDVSAPRLSDLIDLAARKAYEHSHSKGGRIPLPVVREVVENLVHAYFQEAVISVLDDGNTIRVADQGPGITDKERAFVPGFTTATREMKQVIRGVGSGLALAREIIARAGGTITIEDNIKSGAVVTLNVPRAEPSGKKAEPPKPEEPQEQVSLSDRQKKVLFLVTELGPVGPSKIAQELDISLSSAYRDLLVLERYKLVRPAAQGKRALTQEGTEYLDNIFKS